MSARFDWAPLECRIAAFDCGEGRRLIYTIAEGVEGDWHTTCVGTHGVEPVSHAALGAFKDRATAEAECAAHLAHVVKKHRLPAPEPLPLAKALPRRP